MQQVSGEQCFYLMMLNHPLMSMGSEELQQEPSAGSSPHVIDVISL